VSTHQQPAEEAVASTRVIVLPMVVVCMLAMLNFVDRMLLASFLPAVKQEYALSDTRAGVLVGSFAVLYALGAVPLGRLADKYSRRVLIGGTAALWSIATAACGLANSYWTLFAGRIAVACGESGYLPASYSLISDWFPPVRRNLALGLLGAAAAGGGALGILLGGVISAAYGWHRAFVLVGLPGLAIAALAYALIRDPVRGGQDAPISGLSAPAKEAPTLPAALALIRRNRAFLWIWVTSACNAFCHLGITQWLPSFFQRTRGLSPALVGAVFGSSFGLGLGLGGFIGGVLASRLARKHIFEPLRLCIITNLAVIPGFLLVLWSADPRVAISASLASMFVGTLGQAALSAGAQNAVAPRLRGLAHGLLMIGAALVGMGIGPALVGTLSDVFAPTVGDARALQYALSLSLVLFAIAGFGGWRAYIAGRHLMATR
jgi:MFS transporter, Spinster family, sphingosine-1-phosphate transporter